MMKRNEPMATQSIPKGTNRSTFARLFWRPEWVIVLAALLSDLNSWGHQFVVDDLKLVVLNKSIQDPSRVLLLFKSPFIQLTTGIADLYRPFTSLTLALNYWVSGAHPDGFHGLNRLLHVLTCVVIFWVVRSIIPKPPQSAFVAALVYAVHPIQTEAITYISGRADALVALFFVLAWFNFIRMRTEAHPATKSYLYSLCFYVLALLSKETAITWIGVMFLTELIYFSKGLLQGFLQQVRRDFWRVYSGYIGITLVFLLVRFAVLKGITVTKPQFLDNPLAHASYWIRLLTALKIMLQNIGLFFWPISFSSDYSYNQIPLLTRWTSPMALLVLALIIGFLVTMVWSYRRSRDLFFGLGFFFITYSLVSNLVVPIGTIRADRLIYLPALGLCLPLGAALGRIDEMLRTRLSIWVFRAVLGALLVLLGVRTVLRNRDWTDSFSLLLHDVHVSQMSAKLHNNLGAFYSHTKQYALALEQFRIAESILPNQQILLTNLGIFMRQQGRIDEAISYFRRSLALAPEDVGVRNDLGVSLGTRGDLVGAIDEFDKVLQQDPNNAEAHFNKGYALHMQGKTDEAKREYLRTLEIDPTNQAAKENLAVLLRAIN